MIDPVISMVCIATLAIVTLASALPKWRYPQRFRASLDAFALLPSFAVAPLAQALPMFEAAAALGLLFSATRSACAGLLIALFCVFALALAINIARGHTDIDCGCSGFIGDYDTRGIARIGWWHVGRAALLAVLAAVASMTTDARALLWFDYASAAACTLFALAAWFTLDALLVNLPKLDSLRNS